MYLTNICTIRDQQQLLKKIVETKAEIRTSRERKRLRDEKIDEKYGRIFDPITKSIKNISIPTIPTINIPPATVPTPVPSPVPSPATSPATSPASPVQQSPILPPSPEKSKNENQLYTSALKNLKVSQRDNDGILGLDYKTGLIGGMPFKIIKDGLVVSTPQGDVTQKISNEKVWRLLLVKNPNDLDFSLYTRNNTPAAHLVQFRQVAKKLNLLKNAEEKYFKTPSMRKGIMSRGKYNLLNAGSGLKRPVLFASPRKPLPQLIPSDKNGLINELRICAGEFRAGNHSLVTKITPMVQQALRMGIPKSKLGFLKGIPTSFTMV